MVRTRKRTWFVRVKNPNTGNWATPLVTGEPTRQPQVNGLPSIRLPIQKNEKWSEGVWDDAEMEVYYQGDQQPIEQLERVEQMQGATELIGRGGVELRNLVDTEFQQEHSTTVAENLITNNTTYAANVDTVEAQREDNVDIASVTTTNDFQNVSETVPSTQPFIAQNGNLELAQTGFTKNATFATGQKTNVEFNSGDAAYFGGSFGDTSDEVTLNFNLDYEMPSSAFGFQLRLRPDDANGDGVYSDGPDIDFTLDGEFVGGLSDRHGIGDEGVIRWDDIGAGTPSDNIQPGSHTFKVSQGTASDDTYDQLVVDVVAVYDTRYNYFFDNQVNTDSGYLDGPQNYPDSASITFDQFPTARAVVGATVNSTWDDTTGSQAVALSNDGTNFTSASNTTSLDVDFADIGTSVFLKTTHQRYGTQTGQTPLTGVNGQKINDFSLDADLKAIPFVINQTFNDRVNDSLNTVAGTGNFVWEFQINDGVKTVEFTGNRQRDTTVDLPVSDFTVAKDNSKIVEKAILYGGSNSVSTESITANVGTAVPLNNDYLKEGSETVILNGTSTTYERGTDYDVSYKNGTITALSSGSISDGATLNVDYNFKVRAVFTESGVTDPKVEVISIPEVTTQQLADVVVARLVEELSVLNERVDITIPSDVRDFNAIDTLRIPQAPEFQIKNIEGSPSVITVSGGTRESISSVTNQIQTQLRTVSRKA